MKNLIAKIRSRVKSLYWNLKFRIVNLLHPYRPEDYDESAEPKATTAGDIKVVVKSEGFEKLKEALDSIRSGMLEVSEAAKAASASIGDWNVRLVQVRLTSIITEVTNGMTLAELSGFVDTLPITENMKREVFGLDPIDGGEFTFTLHCDLAHDEMQNTAGGEEAHEQDEGLLNRQA